MEMLVRSICHKVFFFFLRSFSPFPNNDTFWHLWETSLLKTLWEKGEIAPNEQFLPSPQFLAPLAVGQRAYVMVRCPSCVRPSVRVLTFSLNIFFAETTYRILMKFHRNVPTMVLFRISWNNLIPSKTLVAMATKLKIFWNLWKSSCQKP